MLFVENLTVRFGTFAALDHISFRVRPGEILGLLGPNGAGKTTTLRILTGQIPPTEGQVLLGGRSLWECFNGLKDRFGYVPDFDNHLEELSARQNLDLFCRLYRTPPERSREALDTVELLGESNQKVNTFSKGMKKKLTIAREILHRPDLLYLDEPTANLDVHSTVVIRELLKRLARSGTTVLCTTHNMEEAEELCDRIAILDRGRVLEIDTPEGFKRRYLDPSIRAVLKGPEGRHTLLIHLSRENERVFLAENIRSGRVVSIQPGPSSFKDVFLRLTGREFL